MLRPGVRVLLFDTAERVLLFAAVDEAGKPFWFPPGGGAGPGETPEQTARRELFEETGLAEFELGPEIGRGQAIIDLSGFTYALRERWYLGRCCPFDLDTGGFTELEVATIVTHRWWTPADLDASPDRLVPLNLAVLVRSLLRDGAPAELFSIYD